MIDTQKIILEAIKLLEDGYEKLNSVSGQCDDIAYAVNMLDNALFDVSSLIENDEEE